MTYIGSEPLPPNIGGTGVSNLKTSTITLGGALSFLGAFTTQFTVTGNTTLTLPTSGTLATTAQIPSAIPVPLNQGGTQASLVANNGGIFYSTNSAGAILSGTATANQLLLSGSSSAPAWSTATYPPTTTINQILYSSANNTVGGLATANKAVLTTGATGIPVLTALAVDGQLIIGSTAGVPAAATLSAGTGITITNGSNSVSIATTGGAAITNYVPNSGTNPVVPNGSGTVSMLGTGSTTTVGGANTLTFSLTGLTNHAIQIGAGTATLTQLAASATTGQVLQNNAAADPSYSTATYPSSSVVSQILYSSATNVVSGLATANQGVLTTGATGIPVITPLAVNGQLIIGSTAGVPAAATLTAGTGITITNGANSITIAANGSNVIETITGNSGGAESPSAGNFNILGTGSITVAGTANTETVQLTGLTNHAIQIGAGTATLTQLGAGTTGQVLQTNTTADPTWSTATYPSVATTTGTILRADGTNWVKTTSTFADTYAASTLLYSNGANTVTGLATANTAVLTTNSSGVPAWNTLIPTLFSPGITIGGSSAGITYNYQTSYWWQIGGVVFVSINIGLTSKGGLSGNVVVTGFPVSAGPNGGFYTLLGQVNVAFTLTALYTNIQAGLNANATTAGLFQVGSGQSIATVTGANLADTSSFYLSGFYGTN